RSHTEIFPYGTEFHKDQITEAVKAKIQGRDPYEIVPHRDLVGHGTALAGIIGGRRPRGKDRLKCIAPKCEFAIVKLEEVRDSILELAGMEIGTKNVYQLTNIISAIGYLSNLQLKLKKPMVVYLPLGTNFGARDGSTVLERYIDNITERRDFCIVTNTGNQGSGRTHTSGIIKATGDIKDILINIDNAQKTLSIAIYIRRPDIVSFGITSPRGDRLYKIPIPSIREQNRHLTFEENNIKIRYIAHERITGSVNLNIVIENTFEGVWKISLLGEHIVNGLYDSWILQSELLKGDTRFLNPDPNTTLLSPGSARNIVATAYYNQMDNTVIQSSGKGLPRNGKIEPSLTIGGVNLLTLGLNNSLILGTGPSMAGAILAGAVAIVYQWGVVQGNYQGLYPPRLKNLLITATEKDSDKLYPNDEWGFGKLNLNKLYEVLLRTTFGNNQSNITINRSNVADCKDESTSYLYINIPMEIYRRLK
ncbi:S8 family peptidase, partial [Clostridium sp.]|uniref:S8 family peptidase n=1 Tax=Clostridium sp. TaxID=1506 RepID=UPI002FC755DC